MTPNRIEFRGPGELKIFRLWLNWKLFEAEGIWSTDAIYGGCEYLLSICGADHLGRHDDDGVSFRGEVVLGPGSASDTRFNLRVEGEYTPRGNTGWFRITDKTPYRLVALLSEDCAPLMLGGWGRHTLRTGTVPVDLRKEVIKRHACWDPDTIDHVRYFVEVLNGEADSWDRMWEVMVGGSADNPSFLVEQLSTLEL